MKILYVLRFAVRFPIVLVFRFLPYYIAAVLRANLQVMIDVVTPAIYAHPAVLKIPLSLTNREAVFMLSGLITMAPGTVCLDVSEDRKYILVHVMFYSGHKVRKEIKDLERRIGELFDE